MSIPPTYESDCGSVKLWRGDCLEVMESWRGQVDAVVTDPPWGIGEGSGTTSKERGKALYQNDEFTDSEDYVQEVCVPAVVLSLDISGGRGLVAPGVRCMSFYPRPRSVGGFYQPAAVGMCPWGFAGFNPVLFYGDDPRRGRGQSNVMTVNTDRPSCDKHPCAKPMSCMLWMVGKASLNGEVIADPFMGSGTTGVAAVRLGRKFYGCEIDKNYFDIAKRRIIDELASAAFLEGKPLPKQKPLFATEAT